jgi:flagellum-specific peptidoglycan hydrolase FlgJ
MKKIVGLLLVCVVLSSCGARKKANQKKEVRVEVNIPTRETPDPSTVVIKPTYNSTTGYIAFFKAVAIHEMKLYGIPASITLAQGILESGSGRGRLARDANNHFGIKCHDWTGPRVYHDDDRAQECFRKYNDPNQSYRDHSLFLAKRKRYANLFKHKPTDYKAWARGLKKAGYATDPKYPQKLISLIERYELYQYDIFDKKRRSQNQHPYTEKHIVIKGDTLYSISKRYGISVERLKTLNKLNSNALSIGQTLIVTSN